MIGVQDYLLVARTAEGIDFCVATYLYDAPKATALPPDAPNFFAAFTGTVLIKHLATGEIARATYQNGILTQPSASSTKGSNLGASGSHTAGTSGNICGYYTTCYYSGHNGSATTYGTITSSLNPYCTPPGPDSPNGYNSTIIWTFDYSSTNYQCQYVEGGPNPLPPPPPPSGGSGNTSTPNSVSTINTNLLKPCEVVIINALKGLSGNPLLTNLQKLAGTNSGYNWTVKDANIAGSNVTGFTSSGYDANTRSAITTFDSQKFPNASDLSFARTMLHESFHAYLVVYFANDRILANVEYSAMVDAYQVQHQAIDDVNHVEMAFWVANIANALEQYGQSKGYNLPGQFYQDMSWAGLEGTQAYKNLPNVDQRRIQNTILTELTGKDINRNRAFQLGRSPGC